MRRSGSIRVPSAWPQGVEVLMRPLDGRHGWRRGLVFAGPTHVLWKPRQELTGLAQDEVMWVHGVARIEAERGPTAEEVAFDGLDPGAEVVRVGLGAGPDLEFVLPPEHSAAVRHALEGRPLLADEGPVPAGHLHRAFRWIVRAMMVGAILGTVVGTVVQRDGSTWWMSIGTAAAWGALFGSVLAIAVWRAFGFTDGASWLPGPWPRGLDVRVRHNRDGRWRRGVLFMNPEQVAVQPWVLGRAREPLRWQRDRTAVESARNPTTWERVRNAKGAYRVLQLRTPEHGWVELAVSPADEQYICEALKQP